MTRLPDLSHLTHEQKDALILALWAQVQALTARVAELEARLGAPPKTPDNSSLPPSQGKKPNRADKAARGGPRPGSLGRMGGGRALAANPDEIVSARPVRCAHCQAALDEARKDREDAVVRAEISGRVGRTRLEVGARVTGPADLLTTVEQLEPVYVAFRPSSQDLLRWRGDTAAAGLWRIAERAGLTRGPAPGAETLP